MSHHHRNCESLHDFSLIHQRLQFNTCEDDVTDSRIAVKKRSLPGLKSGNHAELLMASGLAPNTLQADETMAEVSDEDL